MPSSTISRGNLLNQKLFALTLTPASVPAQSSNEQTFTVYGINVGDYLNCQYGVAQTAGILVGNVRVAAQNTAAIQFVNCTVSTATPAAGLYGFAWGRPENLPLDTNAF